MINTNVQTVDNFTLGMLKQAFAKGRFATAKFFTDKGLRVLNGKTKIVAALRGDEASYDAESRGQLRVADVNLKDADGKRTSGYRTVTAAKLVELSANGKRIVLKGEYKAPTEFISDVKMVGTSMFVKMNGKTLYQFLNVPREPVKEFAVAESRGKFFNENIKGKFHFVKIV